MINLSNSYSDNLIYPNDYEIKDYPELIFNQGNFHLCVPYSISLIRHIQIYKRYGLSIIPDPIHIYYNRDKDMYQDEGMITEEVLRYIIKYGIPEIDVKQLISVINTCFKIKFDLKKSKYINDSEIKDIDKVFGYKKLNSIEEIKESILKYYGVIATVKHNEAIRYPDKNGYINYSAYETYDENHQLVILGWKSNNWIIQNSYGKEYGINGKAYLPMDCGLLEAYCIIDEE